jgi:hypothetical protein
MSITLSFVATSAAHAKEIVDRVHGEVHITDDMIRDYLVRKGWWKPGVESGPSKGTDTKEDAPKQDVARKNINPGDPSISKIGSSTKDVILGDLAAGRQPPTPKYDEHMKLLWSRGEVKYDGKEYYL